MAMSLQIVGLTGGIASGKSTVARFLRQAGLPVIDADALGHLALAPDGAAYREVVDTFGTGILGVDGVSIDRRRLGALVFDDPQQRVVLEGITHPAIAALSRRGLELIDERGGRLAVYEAALLVETGMHRGLSGLIVVSCSLEHQLERVLARDGLDPAAAAARIASQFPLAEKLAVADWVIENNGTYEELAERTDALAESLRLRFPEVRS
ncbi:MAG TPA: dephospho-CoA kinase [Polyangia bacterium]|nr:dephospho-CoA kinase [Polyangia bacterium]